MLERGEVTAIADDGKLSISSFDRPGAECRLPKPENAEIAQGDKVYFALFADGAGIVLGKVQEE